MDPTQLPPQDCPRCGEPRAWVGHWKSGVSRCERCANDPAIVLEWTRKNRSGEDSGDATPDRR